MEESLPGYLLWMMAGSPQTWTPICDLHRLRHCRASTRCLFDLYNSLQAYVSNNVLLQCPA